MNTKQSIAFTLFSFAVLVVVYMAGYFTNVLLNPQSNSYPILNQAYRILEDHALDPLPEGKHLEYGMIRGMLEVYGDPFTTFVEPVQHELQSNDLQGNFGGIGVRIDRDLSGNLVLYPFPESPAAVEGIQNGDRVLAVEDLEISSDTQTEDVLAAISGPIGTRVQVVIARAPDFSPLEFRIKRAAIPLPSVLWHQIPEEPRVGVIEVNIIADTTPSEIERSVKEMRRLGASHFILDLRENGGGLLEAGVETARLFLNNGIVIEQQYRGEPVEQFKINRSGPLSDIPLAVLIDRNTASSAEVIAGAMKAHGRAPLIGEPTYGKDSIQLVFELDDGSSLHVTAAKWWIPDLNDNLQESSLQPDFLIITEDDVNESSIQRAVEILLETP